MAQQKCSKCVHENSCKTAYQKIGSAVGPNVALKVIVAFLLPIAVFIAAMIIAESAIKDVLPDKDLRTMVVFIIGLAVSLICVLITWVINRHFIKNKDCKGFEGEEQSKLRED